MKKTRAYHESSDLDTPSFDYLCDKPSMQSQSCVAVSLLPPWQLLAS